MAGAFVAITFVAVTFGACVTSESVDRDAEGSGGAGNTGSASGGGTVQMMTGAAGTTTGTAGSTSSPAGGSGQGVAGSTGSAAGGGTTGAAGAKVDAGAPDKSSSGGTAGTPGTADAGIFTDSGYPLTFTAYIEPMLNNACGGCHFDGGSMAPKDGFGYTTYAKLVGPVSADHTGCASLDASKRRVVPGHPENSLIFIKVSVQNPPGGCGGHMPYMGTNMSPQNQADLRAWILAGAPQ